MATCDLSEAGPRAIAPLPYDWAFRVHPRDPGRCQLSVVHPSSLCLGSMNTNCTRCSLTSLREKSGLGRAATIGSPQSTLLKPALRLAMRSDEPHGSSHWQFYHSSYSRCLFFMIEQILRKKSIRSILRAKMVLETQISLRQCWRLDLRNSLCKWLLFPDRSLQ